MNESEKKSSKKNRRTFLSWLLGIGVVGWSAGMGIALVQYLRPPHIKRKTEKTLSLGLKTNITKHKKYKKERNSMIFSFRGKPAIIVQTENNNFRAFSAECTHLSCIVEWKKDKKIFFCNCHGGSYSKDGKNIGGPPPAPLEELSVIDRDGELFIAKRST